MGFFDRRNLAGLQTTAKYAPRRKRGGRRPFLLGQDFCSVKNFPTENLPSAAAFFTVPKQKCFDHTDTEGGFAKQNSERARSAKRNSQAEPRRFRKLNMTKRWL